MFIFFLFLLFFFFLLFLLVFFLFFFLFFPLFFLLFLLFSISSAFAVGREEGRIALQRQHKKGRGGNAPLTFECPRFRFQTQFCEKCYFSASRRVLNCSQCASGYF